ncbi:uncharacterized protein LOC135150446 [Daucus carota subsp. sativus]|uniref:uncharacterized protein LOC135150446 n=1 Tax=Daucus carota subsp. sativus TaxID=79200 RepID=UPI003083B03F
MPPANQQSPVSSQAARTPASKSKRAAKSDAAPSTAKRTRTSVATHVLKPNSDVPTNSDVATNADEPKKRRRLVAAYEYDDLEPAQDVNSEPQISPPKPARFKRRAQKPARAKVPITEITDFTVDEEQTPSSPVAEDSQALMTGEDNVEAQEKSAQDNVEKVADTVPDDDKANSDTEDDDSSDTDKDENDGIVITIS